MGITQVFKSNGFYLGFSSGGNLFSRDGAYLGWIEGNFVWDALGQYRGQVTVVNGNNYILKNMYAVSPIPRIPRPHPAIPPIPAPPQNVLPISLSIDMRDGF